MVEDRFGIERPFVDEEGTGPFGFSRPLAKGKVLRLMGEVNRAIEDEQNAGADYLNIAGMAEEMGYDGIAETFRQAADDEKRHNREFKKELQKLERDIE